MTRAVHLPYTVQQDEDGVWCAHAQLRPGVGAHGEGNSREAGIADLREALPVARLSVRWSRSASPTCGPRGATRCTGTRMDGW